MLAHLCTLEHMDRRNRVLMRRDKAVWTVQTKRISFRIKLISDSKCSKYLLTSGFQNW
uniref:Uncharacterized protein n=1 Tax=Anguilla anguilla TaxID=7936 RepID=A0A0E9T7B1_ANGAN